MSRSGYVDDYDDTMNLYRGRVERALRGDRGQRMLSALCEALDTMPVKELIAHELATGTGEVCAIGALGVKRGVDMTGVDPEDARAVAALFDIAESMAREIVYENDEGGSPDETPDQRWQRMRDWVVENIIVEDKS